MPLYGNNAGKYICSNSISSLKLNIPEEIEINLSLSKRNRGFGKGASTTINKNNC